jgi:FtsP/CotA-like multicopper oxidase with cupredoxin domain
MDLQRMFEPRPTHASVLLYSAALLTLGTAAIHFVVAPPHLREYAPFGVFFLAVACAQVIYAVELLLRPTRGLALLMAAGSGTLVALWFVSRTSGLPFGPLPGTPEPIGMTDIICVVLETLAALLFAAFGLRQPRRRVRRVWLRAVATIPSALFTFALTALAIAGAMTSMPESVNAAPRMPGQAAISAADLTAPPGSEPLDRFTLVAQVSQIDGATAWTYNGMVPGPELRVRQGDRVQVTLINQLPESTTVHWHGLQLPNAMDGVAGLTQDAVPPGQSFTYEFVARDAGTYWYHSHQQTEAQLQRGLFGALVIEPLQATEDCDYAVVLHGAPGHVRVSNTHLEARPGQTVRVRIINAVAPGMDGGPEVALVAGAPFTVAALDGHDLQGDGLLDTTRIPLGMGQRADVVFTMPPSNRVELRISELQADTTFVQEVFERLSPPSPRSDVVTVGDGSAPLAVDPASAPMFDALNYGAPVAADSQSFDTSASIILDKKPGVRDGRVELVHTLNGQASPNVSPLEVTQGEHVLLHIVNNTDEFHPMHIHGHVFTVVARNGEPVSGSPLHLDSVLVGPREAWDVAFVADNPGIWMIHCHVLLHAGMGMSMTLDYSGVYSPFEMGSQRGNMPE